MTTPTRWRFWDQVTNTTYTFPVNPKEQTSPYLPRNITVAQINVARGQAALQEGLQPPTQWQFSGTVRDLTFMQDLLTWSRRDNRFFVYDDLGRRMFVMPTTVDFTRRAGSSNPYRQDYVFKALVFEVA